MYLSKSWNFKFMFRDSARLILVFYLFITNSLIVDKCQSFVRQIVNATFYSLKSFTIAIICFSIENLTLEGNNWVRLKFHTVYFFDPWLRYRHFVKMA